MKRIIMKVVGNRFFHGGCLLLCIVYVFIHYLYIGSNELFLHTSIIDDFAYTLCVGIVVSYVFYGIVVCVPGIKRDEIRTKILREFVVALSKKLLDVSGSVGGGGIEWLNNENLRGAFFMGALDKYFIFKYGAVKGDTFIYGKNRLDWYVEDLAVFVRSYCDKLVILFSDDSSGIVYDLFAIMEISERVIERSRVVKLKYGEEEMGYRSEGPYFLLLGYLVDFVIGTNRAFSFGIDVSSAGNKAESNKIGEE